jgi:predicted RNA binding protein YcfA (HicA-like mRNA interferase family)
VQHWADQAMKVRDIVAALEAAGWEKVDQRGDHRYFTNPDQPERGKVTVAGGWNVDMPPGTLSNIRRQTGVLLR